MKDKLELALQKNVIALFAFTVFAIALLAVLGIFLFINAGKIQDHESVVDSPQTSIRAAQEGGVATNSAFVDKDDTEKRDPSVGRAARIDSELETCTASDDTTYGLIDCYKKAQTSYDALVIQIHEQIAAEFDTWISERKSWEKQYSADDARTPTLKRSDDMYVSGIMQAKVDLANSLRAFTEYRESLCGYAHNTYNDGSMRYLVGDSCQLEVTMSHLKSICSPMTDKEFCENLYK